MPVRSPLLRQSQLISYPPLIYMLKFRGLSCVNRQPLCRVCKVHRPAANAGRQAWEGGPACPPPPTPGHLNRPD